jgi:hypothetical protein
VYPPDRLPLCPLTVTVTVTAPTLPAGVVAVIVVLLTTTTLLAAAPPNVSVAPLAKFVPVIVTVVPPVVAPLLGLTLVTVGGARYVKPLTSVPLRPLLFVTATVTAPALPAGVVAVMVVLFTTLTLLAAAPPNFTVAPLAKFVPVIVTTVPPAVGPPFGLTLVTLGGAMYVNAFAKPPLWPPGFPTVTITAPALPAGVVAVIWVPLTTTTLVAAAGPNVTVAPTVKFVPVIVTAVPPAVVPLFGLTPVTVGAGPVNAPNATICITHGPAELNAALALLLPAVVTTLSSAISPSGAVITRDVKPLPAAVVVVATMSAPKTKSLARVVVAEPLFADVLLPLAPAVTSTAFTPLYSKIRMSGKAAAWLNVTVTVFDPPAMFDA